MAVALFSGLGPAFGDAGKYPTTQVGTTAMVASINGLVTSTSKLAMMGQVWFPEASGSKSIVRVGFLFGTPLIKSNGSALTLSLQDVSLTGTVIQPDGTPDQTVAIPNADAAFAALTWFRTSTLSAPRSVSCGDWLAVVWEYDGSGKQTGDDIRIAMGNSEDGNFAAFEASNTFNGSVWGSTTGRGVYPVVFEFSDGSFGRFGRYGFPFSAIDVLSYASNTSGADEHALEFKLVDPIAIEGGEWVMTASGDDVDLILYRGTTVLATSTFKGKYSLDTTNRRRAMALFSDAVQLSANTVYRLAVRPSSTNPIALAYFDVADADHMQLHFGGVTWRLISRVDGGAWAAPVKTRRPYIWPILAGW